MGSLIADDPTQFEAVTYLDLRRQIEALEIKQAWGRLRPEDKRQLDLMLRELENRAVFSEIIDGLRNRPVGFGVNQNPEGATDEPRDPKQT